MLRKDAKGILYQANEAESDEEEEAKGDRPVHKRFVVFLWLSGTEGVVYLGLLAEDVTRE